jgi:F0F1-type ATP synthase assembly protein I
MANRDENGWRTALETIGQVGQVGFTFAFSVLISVGIGYWLDKLAGTDRLFKLVFLVFGLLSGGLSVYKSLSSYLHDGE